MFNLWLANAICVCDMSFIFYVQVASKSQDAISRLPVCLRSVPDDVTDEKLVKLPDVVEYKDAVSELLNEGENLTALNRYKSAVKRLLLSSPVSS